MGVHDNNDDNDLIESGLPDARETRRSREHYSQLSHPRSRSEESNKYIDNASSQNVRRTGNRDMLCMVALRNDE